MMILIEYSATVTAKQAQRNIQKVVTMAEQEKIVEILHEMGDLVSSAADYKEMHKKIRVGANGLSLVTGIVVWGWREDQAHIGKHPTSKIFDGTHFVKYDGNVSKGIEKAYQRWQKDKSDRSRCRILYLNKKNVEKARNPSTGTKYFLFFDSMYQKNVVSGYKRALCRKEYFKAAGAESQLPPPLSTRGGAFLPTFCEQVVHVTKTRKEWHFGRVVFDPVKEVVDRPTEGWFPAVLCREANLATLRKMAASLNPLKGAPSLLQPKTWEAGKEGRVKLPKDSEEYQRVSQFFKNSATKQHKVTNIRIERIQSKELWGLYVVKRDSLKKRNAVASTLVNNTDTGKQERGWLFHGTESKNTSKIIEQGFNRSFAGSNGTKYGKGSYFATDASRTFKFAKSDTYGTKQIFMCRVAVGDWCQGSRDHLVPDPKPGTDKRFDSTVDNAANPSIFVTYHDAQAYPEYLVSFRCAP